MSAMLDSPNSPLLVVHTAKLSSVSDLNSAGILVGLSDRDRRSACYLFFEKVCESCRLISRTCYPVGHDQKSRTCVADLE